MGNDYSSYINDSQQLPTNVCAIVVLRGLFYGINLSDEIIKGIYQVHLDVWKKEIKQVKYYNANLVEFVHYRRPKFLGESVFNIASLNRMYSRFYKLFRAHGWSLANSPTLTFEHSLSSWFYIKEINPCMIPTDDTDNELCVISLCELDSLRFIDFPTKFEEDVTECVSLNWAKGIQRKGPESDIENVWTIKLRGYPWRSSVNLESRSLVFSLIRFMSNKNWRLVNSTAITISASDSLFFRNFSNAFNVTCPDTIPESYFMLALYERKNLVIFGGDEYILRVIGNTCARHEKNGINPKDSIENYPAVIINTDVWSYRNEDELKTRRLMTLLFQDLASIGWLPTESIDCSRSVTRLSNIVFVRIQPVRMIYFCLCPKKFSGINLINAPDEVLNLVYDTFFQYYPIEKEKIVKKPYGIGTTIEFVGNPFRFEKHSLLLFQQTLAVIISTLNTAGWILMLSADTSDETLTRDRGEDSSETVKYSIYGLWFAKVIS